MFNEEDGRSALDAFAETRRAIQVQQATVTCGTLWERWIADRAADQLSNEVHDAQWKALGPYFGHRAPHLVTSDDCRNYARERFALGRAPSTVNTELSRLRACFRWAAKQHLIERVPPVWIPSGGRPRSLVLTPNEARALIDAAHQHHIYLFIVLALATGARHRAICDLTWDRVDFENGTIQYDELLPPDPMSRSYRKGRATVPMTQMVRAALLAAKEGALTNHVIEYGGRAVRQVHKAFARVVALAELNPDITPHTIRHTVATWLKERGATPEKAAAFLGHRDSKTTERVYFHPDATIYLTDAADQLDSALPESTKPGRVASRKRDPKRMPLSQRDNRPDARG